MTSKKYFGDLSKEEQLSALKSKEVKTKVLDYLSTEIIENLDTDLTTHHALFISIDLNSEKGQLNLKLQEGIAQPDIYGTMYCLVHTYLPSLGYDSNETKAIQMGRHALELSSDGFAKVHESLMDLLLGILSLDLTELLLNSDNIVDAYQDSLVDMSLEGIEGEIVEGYFLLVKADSLRNARKYLEDNASFEVLEHVASKETMLPECHVVYIFKAKLSDMNDLLVLGDISVYKRII